MENDQKYNFSDFTLRHYEEILLETKKNHVFESFSNFDKSSNFVLNRHDVDFSIENALKLAVLESENETYSTYLFMIHSEYYNFLEKETIEVIKKIKLLGHNIGLHFDAQFYEIKKKENLDQMIEVEKNIMERYLDIKIEVFSFHNTTDFTMNCKDWSYGGLINTYSDYFQSNVEYCSDSNGYWRFERMLDFVKANEHNKIQLLTHPIWWTEEIMSPKEKVNNCIEKRANKNKIEYNNILKYFNRSNIDW